MVALINLAILSLSTKASRLGQSSSATQCFQYGCSLSIFMVLASAKQDKSHDKKRPSPKKFASPSPRPRSSSRQRPTCQPADPFVIPACTTLPMQGVCKPNWLARTAREGTGLFGGHRYPSAVCDCDTPVGFPGREDKEEIRKFVTLAGRCLRYRPSAFFSKRPAQPFTPRASVTALYAFTQWDTGVVHLSTRVTQRARLGNKIATGKTLGQVVWLALVHSTRVRGEDEIACVGVQQRRQSSPSVIFVPQTNPVPWHPSPKI